jgi:rubrerythrin
MAHVNTEQKPDVRPMRNVSEIVRALRGAAADELSAANLYSSIIDDLKAAGHEESGGLITRIKEIMEDEEQHLGSLLFCVGELDSSIAKNMEAGASGE